MERDQQWFCLRSAINLIKAFNVRGFERSFQDTKTSENSRRKTTFFFIKKKGSYINYKSLKFDLSPEWTQRCWFQFDMNSGFCKVFRNVL